MTRILILIPLWKRHEIFKIVAANLVHFINKTPEKYIINVLCIISPEDPSAFEQLKTCLKYNFHYFEYKNQPLGDKMNAGINHSLKNIQYDYLMNFGSDDLIHPDIFKLYESHFQKKELFFGINNLFFYDTTEGKTIHYRTKDSVRCIGAGRMIIKELVQGLLNKKTELYEYNKNRGMDSCSSNRLKEFAGANEIVIDSGTFPYIIDLKTGENINDISIMYKLAQRITFYENDILASNFPHVTIF